MKRFFAIFIFLPMSCLCFARATDTAKNAATAEPEYPGGPAAFYKYIRRNLKYPFAAKLMGINGNVYVSFTVAGDGKVTKVAAINCLGAGCESEAVKVVQKSRAWKPGKQNGRPVSVNFTVPINFNMEPEKVYMENLLASDYGFVFSIKGVLYSADEAEAILGKTFKPERIASAEPFKNDNDDQKLGLRNKKERYLLVIKSP